MKTKLGAIPLIYPIPITLCGTNVNSKANFMTIGDCGLMGIHPALVYVSSHAEHYSTAGILANGTFSINIPTTALIKQIEYCGSVSGKKADKAKLFDVFYGELRTAPMIRQCPVNMECRVCKEFSIQRRHIFIGEVIQTYIDEDCYRVTETGDRIYDTSKLDPIIYSLDDRFFRIGEILKLSDNQESV